MLADPPAPSAAGSPAPVLSSQRRRAGRAARRVRAGVALLFADFADLLEADHP